MIIYLDSSVVLRVLFDQPGKLRIWGNWTAAYTNELLAVECRRAIDRLRLEGLYEDRQVASAVQQLSRMEKTMRRVRLSRAILQRASATMPTVVKTLDAIHLVSAEAIRSRMKVELLFATHDAQQSIAALALGFACEGC